MSHEQALAVRRESVRWPFSDEILEEAKRLGRRARDGELALFMGAGVSIPAGLPTWDDLLKRLPGSRSVPTVPGSEDARRR